MSLYCTWKSEHITPIFKQLHWLTVVERINFNILILTFKAIHGIAPVYLKDILTPYKPTRMLRSANKELLVVPKYNLKTYGRRAFSITAPLLWNNLPDDVRTAESLGIFKSRLKTFLFKRAY